MRRLSPLAALVFIGCAALAQAQLPPDSVMLDKVKVAEKIKSEQFDPVYLLPADPKLPTWTHEGVTYGAAKADSQQKFMAEPAKYAEAAKRERYVQNFIASMSIIWCPVTDEVNPGGLHEWVVGGIKYEACCEFCESSYRDEDFVAGLDRLKKRAGISYELTSGGKYTEGAKSPVEGAIKKPAPGATAGKGKAGVPAGPPDPDYLKGKDLKPNYTGGVALVFENRCVGCHRPGGMAPMSFASLNEIKKWTKSMKTSVVSRGMPPWPADLTVGSFANARALSQKEIDVISQWADAGYPAGEGEYKSERIWPKDWSIGEPDHVFQLPSFKVGADVVEEVKETTLETSFPEDRWIVASQAILGNELDTFAIEGGPLGMFAAGNLHVTYPEGTGRLLKAGEKLKVHVHYVKEKGYESTDPGAKIGVKFAKDPSVMKTDLRVDPMANTIFAIPPGAADFEVKCRFEFPADGRVVSLMPVMKMRGKSVSYKAILPGGVEKPLLSIPRWDPAWKLRYVLAEPLAAPKGTIVEMSAHYDNSAANMKNPDAKAEVKAVPGGEAAEGWLGYALN